MRLSSIFMILAGTLAAFSLYFLWTSELPRKRILENPSGYVDNFLNAFSRDLKSTSYPLSKLTKNRTPELLNAKTLAGNISSFHFSQIEALYNYAMNCKPTDKKFTSQLGKAFQWHRFLCNHQKKLDSNFFENPPLLHPSGHSYIYLAKQSGKSIFDETWVKKLESKTHILEAKELGLDDSDIDVDNLMAIANGQRLSVGFDKVLLVNSELRRYREISRNEWNDILDKALLKNSSDNRFCVSRLEGICWQLSTRNTLSERVIYFSLALSLLFTLVALIILWRDRNTQKKKSLQDRQFLLKLLTHELRTPAASLNLILENFREKYDALPDNLQRDFVSMSSQVSRLNRVLEASKKFLRLKSEKQISKIDSVNVWFREILYDYPVTLSDLQVDRSLRADPYLLEIAVLNLVDNAVRYGLKPIQVVLSAVDTQLDIQIIDNGQFAQSLRSDGLGIGLTVVRDIVENMGGNFHQRNCPTTFSIRLEGLYDI